MSFRACQTPSRWPRTGQWKATYSLRSNGIAFVMLTELGLLRMGPRLSVVSHFNIGAFIFGPWQKQCISKFQVFPPPMSEKRCGHLAREAAKGAQSPSVCSCKCVELRECLASAGRVAACDNSLLHSSLCMRVSLPCLFLANGVLE